MKGKRLVLLMAAVILLSGLISPAAAEKKIPVSDISLDKTEATVRAGSIVKLTAAVTPKNATVKGVKWESSDTAIATVSKGRVKGIAPGTVTITARPADGSDVQASAQITVVIPVKSIKAEKTSVELAPGATHYPSITITPENAGIREIDWKTSDRKVAVVDSDGSITAVKAGKCTVTGTAADGSGASVIIRVKVTGRAKVRPEDKGEDIAPEGPPVRDVEGTEAPAGSRTEVLPWTDEDKEKMEIRNSSWITFTTGDTTCPVFRKVFSAGGPAERAELQITALGVYEAELNGERISDYVLAPGWTSYEKRLQVQKYDVTALLKENNELRVTVGNGWYRSPIPAGISEENKTAIRSKAPALIALLTIRYEDGTEEKIPTGGDWEAGKSPVLFSELYDGETYDATAAAPEWQPAAVLDRRKENLIPQEGEVTRETERITARRIFRTPAGEILVDFGQNVTGYVEFTVDAKAGDVIRFNHGETLDRKGNFYNENYRSAKAEVTYTCREGIQTWHPRLTFFGFRYIHLIDFPGTPQAEQFTAVAVHSDMQRTGWLESGSEKLNRLFSNIVWSQRDNFLDIPSDCPQRDERLGWTGDAQVFIRTASYLFDTETFFRKWLRDMAADQHEDGGIPQVVPDVIPAGFSSAAWGDAATICPWQLYQTYGDVSVLEEQYDCMKKWVDYITLKTTTPNLWTGGAHFGDWLGLDAPGGSYRGSSREDFIATAFYAHSTELLIRAGQLLGMDTAEYEALHERIVAEYRRAFPKYQTQTEYALAIQFDLAEDPQKAADALAKMIKADGMQLRTGFVGTPYILHALSRYGHADLAWDLLLREEYPGWLYPLSKGATTMWEHWDGIREDGGFWGPEMNSFNHYAYGSVADWVIEQAAGIRHDEAHPAFSEMIWEPHPDKRAGWLTATLNTRNGTIRAAWRYEDGRVRYELTTPVETEIRLNGETFRVRAGSYMFWGK